MQPSDATPSNMTCGGVLGRSRHILATAVPGIGRDRSWRNAAVALACCLTVLVLVYRPTVVSMLYTWTEDPFGHGYVVVPAVLCLAFIRRSSLESITPRAAVWALPAVGASSLLWLLATRAGQDAIQQSAVVATAVSLTWAVLGTAAVRALAFPLGLLLFVLPVGHVVAPLLQHFTGRAAAAMLQYSRVAAALDGDVISTAGTRWHVSEACGGIHYLIASAGIGYVYAGLVYRRWTRRAGFIAAAMVVPIVGNLVRVYTTIILDELGATRLVAGMGHDLYGVFVFTMMMSVLFITCGQWSDAPRFDENSPRRRSDDSAYQPWRSAALATAALALAVAPPLLAAAFTDSPHGRAWSSREVQPPVLPRTSSPARINSPATAWSRSR
jgi:exosortase A